MEQIKRMIFPVDTQPLILEKDAALWLIRNQERIATLGWSKNESGEYIAQLINIKVPKGNVPANIRKYLLTNTPIPIELGSKGPFAGKPKFKGVLKLTANGVKAWKAAKLPGLKGNLIDIDAYLDSPNGLLTPPDIMITRKEDLRNEVAQMHMEKTARVNDVIEPLNRWFQDDPAVQVMDMDEAKKMASENHD